MPKIHETTLLFQPLFSLDDRQKQLGLGSKGVSTYFTPNCTQEDADLVNRFFKDIDMEGNKTTLLRYVIHSLQKTEMIVQFNCTQMIPNMCYILDNGVPLREGHE